MAQVAFALGKNAKAIWTDGSLQFLTSYPSP